MKLRMTHNSIRIRIKKSELEQLKEKRGIMESIIFPNASLFMFSLVIDDIPSIKALFEDGNIIIGLPLQTAKEWITTNQVGIETHIPIEGEKNEQLHVLIEKDFPCIDRPNEDKSDTFWELVPDKIEQC